LSTEVATKWCTSRFQAHGISTNSITKGELLNIWNHCTADTVFYSKDEAWTDYPCTVKLTDEEIIVEYEEDDQIVQYRGRNNGDGHFELTSKEVGGRASLHMFHSSRILEGSWRESGERGMWIIRLA
jgi:hypothetical protein